MPDLSMCQNDQCAIRSRCYRFTAKPGPYQQYSYFQPNTNLKCDFFIANIKNKEPVKVREEFGKSDELGNR